MPVGLKSSILTSSAHQSIKETKITDALLAKSQVVNVA